MWQLKLDSKRREILLLLLFLYFIIFNYSIESKGSWLPVLFHFIPIFLIFLTNRYKRISHKFFISFFLLLYFFYFFEIIKPILKSILLFDFNSIILVLSIFLFLVLIIKEKLSDKMILILIISFSFLIIYESTKLILSTSRKIEFKSFDRQTNILYIILDEYTSFNTLEKQFNYSNKDLDKFKSSYYFINNSISYYPTTYFSINHLFNLQIKNYDFQLKNYDLVIEDFYDNAIFNLFNKNKYQINVKGPMDSKFGDSPYGLKKIKYYNYIKKYNRISSSLFMQLLIWKEFNGMFKNTFKSNYRNEAIKALYSRDSINNAFKKDLFTLMSKNPKEPFFHYYHFLVPHSPYCYKNGAIDTNFNTNFSKLTKSLYLNNVKYCDQYILAPILDSFLNSELKDNTIMIIQGDHGYRGQDIEKKYFCDILNIIYIPKTNKNLNFEKTSNTNTLIRILNNFFNQNIEEIK